MSGDSTKAAKPICSICYEDLKPFLEDLQSISLCGHVFHEICIQQWIEYCPAGKKPTCPVCKQSCSRHNVTRLYFQSIGDSTQSLHPHNTSSSGVDVEALEEEVRRLEGKLSAISSAFERQKEHVTQLNDEVLVWKERSKKEEALKEAFQKEKTNVLQLLQAKNEELCQKLAECSGLKERSLALAKELAALKLVSDLNLNEEEMSKLSFVGSGGSTEHTVDVLKKSLALRNKSYKELMAQCNLMGRGEARSLQKLEKAEAKIKKLKTRLQELERTSEEKDNEVLRSLKKSKSANLSANKQSSDPPSVIKCSLDDQIMNVNEAPMALKKTRLMNNHPSCLKLNMDEPEIINFFGSEACKETNNIIDVDLESDSWCFIKEDGPECYEEMAVRKYKKLDQDESTSSYAKDSGSKTGTTADLHIDLDKMEEESVSHTLLTTLGAEALPYHDIAEHPHQFSIKREHQNLGSNPCISGSEEATKYIGKWCKRAQIRTCSSPTMQGSSATGELISIGADGRGGRIKVLRSHNQLMDDKAHSSIWPKRLKNGAKQGGQTKGCLQIEHFFTKGGGQF